MRDDRLTPFAPNPLGIAQSPTQLPVLGRSHLFHQWQQFRPRLRQWQQAIAQTIRQHMLNPAEPRVSVRRDRHGNPLFHIYDPRTGRSATFSSEAEVRWWLEQLYRDHRV